MGTYKGYEYSKTRNNEDGEVEYYIDYHDKCLSKYNTLYLNAAETCIKIVSIIKIIGIINNIYLIVLSNLSFSLM